jgi:hypothetical protein
MRCPNCATDISETQGYVKLVDEMNEALNFLEGHPALGGGTVFTINDLLWYSVQEVCKRGYCRLCKGEIDLHYTPENYKKYKELFDEEIKQIEPGLKTFARISVPYADHFGEPWKFDHVEYWGELSIVIFRGMNFDKYYDIRNWERLQGVEASSRSFEELIINIADEVKKLFGNFSEENFLTEKEKENHRAENPFFFVKCKDKPNCSQMKHNRSYMMVTDAEINRRWFKWFVKTPYGKKNWAETYKEALSWKDK